MDLKNMVKQEEEKRDIKENVKSLAWALDNLKNKVKDDEMPDTTRTDIIGEIECLEVIAEVIQKKIK